MTKWSGHQPANRNVAGSKYFGGGGVVFFVVFFSKKTINTTHYSHCFGLSGIK